MIKAVVFDLDDTLLQTRQTKSEAIKYVGKQFYNLDISDETISLHWGKPFRTFIREVYGEIADVDQMIANYKSKVKQFKNIAYPETASTLQQLFPLYKVCILSSAAQSLVHYDLESAGLPVNAFTFIQSAEDTQVHKPDPNVFQPMLKVLKEYEISADQSLYVGDMIFDFKASTGAGFHFRGLADRTISKAEFEEVGATTISSIAELPDLLLREF